MEHEHYSNYFVGVVILCPVTNKQIALHKNSVNFNYWNVGSAGHEVDINITNCPSCKTKHIITVPLEHWGTT